MGRSSVIIRELCDKAALIVPDGKGLLLAEESNATCNRRWTVPAQANMNGNRGPSICVFPLQPASRPEPF